MKRFDQTGSHLIGLLLFALFIGVVGFTGYKVWQLHSAAATHGGATATLTTQVPTAIKTSGDLTQAASALDAASSQLNASLNDSALNTDMQSML